MQAVIVMPLYTGSHEPKNGKSQCPLPLRATLAGLLAGDFILSSLECSSEDYQ